MKVVGVGCGPGLVSEEAITAISAAKRIVGSGRAVGLVTRHIAPDAMVEVITDYRGLSRYGSDTVVLSTGDPMLAGLGKQADTVIPGISSFQVAMARLHLPWESCVIIDIHGKDMATGMDTARAALAIPRNLFILADPSTDLRWFCTLLSKEMPDLGVAVLSDLSYPSETIRRGTARNPPVPASRLYCAVIGTF